MSDGDELRDELRELARRVDTAAICDAAKDTRVMSAALRCRSARAELCGPALTVRCRDDFFGLVLAIERAAPGDVIVVDGGGRETALAGELFTRAALAAGVAGLIVDAGCRDLSFVAGCELPVYSRYVTAMAGTTQRLGTINEPVTCGGVTVRPGDLVLADQDGIVVLDPATVAATLKAAAAVKAAESRVETRLAAGGRLSDCLNVEEHADRLARGEPSTLRITA